MTFTSLSDEVRAFRAAHPDVRYVDLILSLIHI